MSFVACGDRGGPTQNSNCINGVCPYTNVQAPAGGVAQFSVLPVAPAAGLSLTALGNLNPPGAPGVWGIDPSAPRPENVTTANGTVIYPLINPYDGGAPVGRVLVQMLTDTQIKIELFMGANASQTTFDANVWTFVR